MAERRLLREMSPFRGRPLTIPPDSWRDWFSLAAWGGWMGILVYGALSFGARPIVTAPDHIVTVLDFTNCYAAPPIVQPCERVAYRAGGLNVMLNFWCGLLLIVAAVCLLWELWSAVAPKPITDDFLKLLDDSFGRNWRRPRSWPWTRMAWAYGFPLAGATVALSVGLLISAAMSSLRPVKTPVAHVETSQHIRSIP